MYYKNNSETVFKLIASPGRSLLSNDPLDTGCISRADHLLVVKNKIKLNDDQSNINLQY